MKFMLNCRDMTRLLSQSHDTETTPAVRVRLHLMACRGCRNVDVQMQFVRTALQQLRVQPTSAGGPMPALVEMAQDVLGLRGTSPMLALHPDRTSLP
jgi:hypothetical protein